MGKGEKSLAPIRPSLEASMRRSTASTGRCCRGKMCRPPLAGEHRLGRVAATTGNRAPPAPFRGDRRLEGAEKRPPGGGRMIQVSSPIRTGPNPWIVRESRGCESSSGTPLRLRLEHTFRKPRCELPG